MISNSVKDNCLQKINTQFEFLFEADLRNAMCDLGQIKSFNEGHQIMEIGQAITHFPLIISGSVKIMTEDNSDTDLLLYYLEVGDTCAITLKCCSKRSKSQLNAICETACQILFIPVEYMDKWMVKYASWRNYVLESYNDRLNEMLIAIDNLAFNNMEERLYKYLKDKAWVTKSATLKITHANIADDLNSSRVVISRLMKKLEIDHKIRQFRNKIELIELMN